MKSIVRWAGSKRRLLPELRRLVPSRFRTYVEPFAGSACLFFDLKPARAILGDLNQELIASYREIRRDPLRVLTCFRRFRRGERAYYSVRKVDPASLTRVELAARFLYLNRFCFNGLYRTNMAGRFNVPYGPPTKPLVQFETDVIAASGILAHAELLDCDFQRTLSYVKKGDFVYLDPPYVLHERRVFSEYLPGSFMSDDLERLADCLAAIDKKGATFILSYADSVTARKLTGPWYRIGVAAPRNIAGFTGARRTDREMLASNRPL